MSKLSLKLRLILVLTIMVGLTGLVGITSYLAHRDIQEHVAVFSAGKQLDLREFDLETNRLELEGSWDQSGRFIAEDVEIFPGRRRPKLRGRIQSLSQELGLIVMYGQPIEVAQELGLAQLEAGQRVEVTCEIQDRGWVADKINVTNVKQSDKIKGCASLWDLDGEGPPSIEIHGIQISLPAKSEPGVASALQDIDVATALSSWLFELRLLAYSLADDFSTGAERQTSRTLALESQGAQLLAAYSDLEHLLTRAGSTDGRSSPGGSAESKRWTLELAKRLPTLKRKLQGYLDAVHGEPAKGRAYLEFNLVPFLDEEIESRLKVFMRQAQDELGDRARSIEAKTGSTSRVALLVGILATLVAMVLGYLLLRSIRRPLRALELAASKIASGDLSARVEVDSPDELGALAAAFNRMSETLASTTVSIDNLQNILDSMAGSLFLLSPDQRVISANHAAARLLSREASDLIGKPFASFCAEDLGKELFKEEASTKDVNELALLSGMGEKLYVSFSAAELRSPNGSLQGYVCIAQDLSDQKRKEGEVRSSLQEKELLLREVHHRVKNNMQVISSLLAMQQEHSQDPTVVACLEQGQARIRSMALIHEHLYQSADLAQANVATYLSLLANHIERSFEGGNSIELTQELEPLTLDLDNALALGLIVNELLTNSYQHAFEQQDVGGILLSLRQLPHGLAQLIVADNGPGTGNFPDQGEAHTLGLSLVQTLVDQLGGQMEVSQAKGIHTCITFPHNETEQVD